MNAAIDPWVITPRERAKYQEQFRTLQPQNGIVTGQQARGFFLQSQLPPLVLGEIWALADTDSDGKMNINEFSIACKIINLKLRGFEIPKTLPPTLLASLAAVGGTPTLTPTGPGSLSPLDPLKSLSNVPIVNNTMIAGPPGRPALPNASAMQALTSVQAVPTIPPVQAIPSVPVMQAANVAPPVPPLPAPALLHKQINQQILPSVVPLQQPLQQQPLIPGNMGMSMQSLTQPIMPASQPPIVPTQPLVGIAAPLVQPMTNSIISPTSAVTGSLIDPGFSAPISTISSDLTNIMNPTSGSLPPPPTPPSETLNRSLGNSEKAPSIESPGSVTSPGDWAIKGPAKLKYTQLFNSTDRTRSGYLTGPQARNLLIQSKLPQTILAQIWALSDMDSDGRLSCDEFVLAMYLCDLALQGQPIPQKLPPDLMPPSFRKTTSRHGSITSATNSRHGSVSSQGAASVVADSDVAAAQAHLTYQNSFEDKRKENYDKGQAELERRRKVLQDIQRKEQEERERKEREEAERREKARLEVERKQQEELERQLQLQRELEQEREEKRKRELEQKEAARKEMEKQRQLEWENQRISEMQLQRQREQEQVLKLKAQNQTYNIELSQLNEKVKELSQKICDTRVNVTSVKTVIDGMRTTRDEQMTEMTQLKARIKEQNAKLVHLSQEKSKMDSKSKTDSSLSQELFTNKQINITQLKSKVENTKEELSTKDADVNTHTEQLGELKTQLIGLIDTCEKIYAEYDSQRNQVMEMKNNKKNDSMTSAWDTAPSAWSTDTGNDVAAVAEPPAVLEKPGFIQYRAVYEFFARNNDEISFQPGDTVWVPIEQNAEPGWLAGEINGHTGWFPETYAEKVDSTPIVESIYTAEIETKQVITETIPEPKVQTTTEAVSPAVNGEPTNYISCYPYQSAEAGDLTFEAGEYITVTKKDGDWWTGTIGLRTGIFPSNYVQEISGSDIKVNSDSYVTKTNNVAQQNIADEAKNQEETDTEVSEINTQPKNENVQDQYSRPMSTSSTTSGYRGKKGEVAQVIAPYEATSAEQLSLQRGQFIMIRKKTDSGWWEGELQARGRRRQIGWFPATYVKVLQSGRLSGRSTPVSGGRIHMNETILDKVIALFPYKAQNDDELSFEKDDIISVLGRDEPEWWRGECQGLTGLFPSNYVGPLVSSGNV